MTLQEIRQANSLEEIKPGIRYLTKHMHDMSFGDFHAYRNTLTHKARELGLSFTELNNIAIELEEEGE